MSRGQRLDLIVGFLALAAAWWMALNHLRIEWSINEQYSYGWVVPLLAIYLLNIRWMGRPPMQAPGHATLAISLMAALSIGWLPAHVLQVSSPDWRLIGWALSGLAVGMTLGAIYLLGGRSWLRHFWFPVAFMLVAVPWPVPLEQTIVQSLMRVVAGSTVEVLRWCGFPAVQHGNVISLGAAGRVGFEEACSGVRSMQAMLMVALFFGEIWHKGWLRRMLLLALAFVVALAFTIARTFTLSWLTASRNGTLEEFWHDLVGGFSVSLMFAAFVLIAYFSRNTRSAGEGELHSGYQAELSHLPWGWSASLLGWLLMVCIGTELWYRSAESRTRANEVVIRWPEAQAGFREIDIPERTKVILRHDEGRSATWTAANGDRWAMVYLKWQAGSAAVQLARAHTPDVCVTAAGGRLEADHGIVEVPAGNLTLPAHAYSFMTQRQPLHVFYIRVGDDAGSTLLPADIEGLTASNRVRAALARRRNRGQQVVEVAVTTWKSPEQVTTEFKEFTRQAVRVKTKG